MSRFGNSFVGKETDSSGSIKPLPRNWGGEVSGVVGFFSSPDTLLTLRQNVPFHAAGIELWCHMDWDTTRVVMRVSISGHETGKQVCIAVSDMQPVLQIKLRRLAGLYLTRVADRSERSPVFGRTHEQGQALRKHLPATQKLLQKTTPGAKTAVCVPYI